MARPERPLWVERSRSGASPGRSAIRRTGAIRQAAGQGAPFTSQRRGRPDGVLFASSVTAAIVRRQAAAASSSLASTNSLARAALSSSALGGMKVTGSLGLSPSATSIRWRAPMWAQCLGAIRTASRRTISPANQCGPTNTGIRIETAPESVPDAPGNGILSISSSTIRTSSKPATTTRDCRPAR